VHPSQDLGLVKMPCNAVTKLATFEPPTRLPAEQKISCIRDVLQVLEREHCHNVAVALCDKKSLWAYDLTTVWE
jgi:hypothetical protein